MMRSRLCGRVLALSYEVPKYRRRRYWCCRTRNWGDPKSVCVCVVEAWRRGERNPVKRQDENKRG